MTNYITALVFGLLIAGCGGEAAQPSQQTCYWNAAGQHEDGCGPAEDALTCRPRPVQAIYADVHGWQYYDCPTDAQPADESTCAQFTDPTNDPLRPVTWACDRPGNGSVILAAVSQAAGAH